MAKTFIVILLFMIAQNLLCQPLKETENNSINTASTHTEDEELRTHSIQRRYINPILTRGIFTRSRTKRSATDDCEKLQLCKIHARAGYDFFSAYQQYFVNKENAQLWDHNPRSVEECESRFNCDEDY